MSSTNITNTCPIGTIDSGHLFLPKDVAATVQNTTEEWNRTYTEFSEIYPVHNATSEYIGIGLASTSVIINVLTLTALGLTKGKLSPRLLLAFNLILSELLVTVWIFVENVVIAHINQKYMCICKVLFGPQSYISCNLILVLIALDHYFATTTPLRYAAIVTRTRVFLAISVTWVLSILSHTADLIIVLIYQAVNVKSSNDFCMTLITIQFGHPWTFYFYLALTFSSLLILCALYIPICQAIHTALKTSEPTVTQRGVRNKKNKRIKAGKRYSLVTTLLFSSFIIFYYPDGFLRLALTISYNLTQDELHCVRSSMIIASLYTDIIRILNSIVNPIIYLCTMKPFKSGLKLMASKLSKTIVLEENELRSSFRSPNEDQDHHDEHGQTRITSEL